MRVILTVAESPPAVLTIPAESAVTLTAETYISAIDGNELEYGLTDGTLPIVGVAKVGSAEI